MVMHKLEVSGSQRTASMRFYRLLRLGREGRTIAEDVVQAFDDREARALAYKFMADGGHVEVWDGFQLVERLTDRRGSRSSASVA